MVVGSGLGWSNLATVILSVVLAFVFGYALTVRGVLRSGRDLRSALKVALAADTASIAVMEVDDRPWPGARGRPRIPLRPGPGDASGGCGRAKGWGRSVIR